MDISYVIPCYCSEKTIASVVGEIEQTMSTMGFSDFEIILVNDASTDNTFAKIRELSLLDSHIQGVDLAKNFGQHAALMAGFRQASGEVIVCLDDDGQTPANEIGKFLEKINQGYDVVYAAYDQKKQGGFRNWGSAVNSKMAEIMLGKPRKLAINSYFVMRRFVMEEMLRYEHCYPYVIGLVLRTTKKICNVQVHHRARQVGTSGYTVQKLVSLWMNGFTSFSVKPLRMATYFGVFSAICGFLYLVYVVINHFLNQDVPMGWSSIVAILLLMGGGILIVLGLIGEYVGRIYMCVNAAPQYVIREIVKREETDELPQKAFSDTEYHPDSIFP